MTAAPFSPIHAAAASTGPGLLATVGRWFNNFGHYMTISHQFEARQAEIERLNLLSDAELASRGLSRDRIPHFVYADLLAL